MKVGILTGGGDCPGLNAVIRAVVRKGVDVHGHSIVGFRHGWRGLMDGEVTDLGREEVRGILPRGGTILGSSRTNPYKSDDGFERVRTTIDDESAATEMTFGFDTAVQTAVDAIDRLHTTAESHDRVMVVEVMGRHAGWIALHSGIAGGANVILIPERPFDVAAVCEYLLHRSRRGENASIVVVAEGAVPAEGTMTLQSGAVDDFGHVQLGGVGNQLTEEIKSRTGFDTRATILGHVLRGGTPTAFDRVLATRFGIAAIEAVHDGATDEMVALQSGQIVRVPLADAVGTLKTVDPALYELAETFFG